MKYRYSRFTGEDLDGLDLEELLSRLSDLLLGSGFDNPHGMPHDDDGSGHSMQTLHDAILEALLNGGLLSDEMLEKLLGKDWRDADDAEERLDQLIARILEKLQQQGYLTNAPNLDQERAQRDGQGIGGNESANCRERGKAEGSDRCPVDARRGAESSVLHREDS